MTNQRTNIQGELFPGGLPAQFVSDIDQQNPWWRNKPLPPLPEFRRWPFEGLLKRIKREPPLARITVLRGPRQIGKTTLQYQLIERLLSEGVAPRRILRVQFDELPSFRSVKNDEPILRIVEWYSAHVLKDDLNATARRKEPSYLFFDEVQNLAHWAIQLKALVDRTDVRCVVTGSSALRIEQGRDSLAGRIETLEVGPFRLSEIALVRGFGTLKPFEAVNGFGKWSQARFWRELREHGRDNRRLLDLAFAAFSERGGYPLAQRPDVIWEDVAQQLNETVVKRVIQHDLRVGERGRRRDEQLLEEMFRMSARYCGQAPHVTTLAKEVQQSLAANIGVQRIRKYLEFLDSALLIRAIQPVEIRLKKRKGSAKLCISDHALRAAWLDEVVPLDSKQLDASPEQADLAGRIAESVAGYFFSSIGVGVGHLPARGDVEEVDFVLTAGDHRVPVEIKFQRRIDPVRDTRGLRNFLSKKVNRARVGVLVTRDDTTIDLPDGIVALPLKSLLLVR